MKSKVKPQLSYLRRQRQQWWRFCRRLGYGLCLLLLTYFVVLVITLKSASSGAVDAILVLGGSIEREIYAAELAKQSPQIPILISKGSIEPCVWLVFHQQAAPISNVWLEKCADSTFDNFYYSLPTLSEWGVRKVKLITSESHLPRAKWMAQILLGSHGIWVEPDIVHEVGIPGNRESWFKTSIDVSRSLLWVPFSQFVQPRCSQTINLTQVKIFNWQYGGFHCERQMGTKK
jgi:uncharacterized SAM-binding protein YcdF (DUF218 family)